MLRRTKYDVYLFKIMINNSGNNRFMVLSAWRSHCENSPGSLVDYSAVLTTAVYGALRPSTAVTCSRRRVTVSNI